MQPDPILRPTAGLVHYHAMCLFALQHLLVRIVPISSKGWSGLVDLGS